jgi:hypothetical protein
LPFIRWLHFDKAACEITDQIRAYPVLLRRESLIPKSTPSGRDPIGGCRFSLREKREDEIITLEVGLASLRSSHN